MNYFFSHLRRLDWQLISAVFLLSIFSLIMLYGMAKNSLYFEPFFQKQVIFFVLGFSVMFLISFFNYQILHNYKTILWIFSISILVLVSVLFFGQSVRGSRAWFNFGFFYFQPVEFIKIVGILILAKYFSFRHIESYRFYHLFMSAIYIFSLAGLVFFQPDFGSAMILVFIWLGMIFFIGIRARQIAFLFGIALISFFIAWQFLFMDYQKERLRTFLNPVNKPFSSSYSLIQSKIAIGAGGFWGTGLGNGTQTQFRFLSEPHTDFILSSVGEELGFSGILISFGIFGFILWRLLKISEVVRDNFGKLFILGFILLLFLHFSINTAMLIGLFPIIGISSPFLSYGGSSLLALFIGLGIVQSMVARAK